MATYLYFAPLASKDAPDHGTGHAISGTNFCVGETLSIKYSDLGQRSIWNLCVPVSVAFYVMALPSAFGHFVARIIKMRAVKKMARIAAGRVVALVAGIMLREATVCQKPNCTGSTDNGTLESYVAIAVRIPAGSPRPAFIRFSDLHLLPKPFSARYFGAAALGVPHRLILLRRA